MSNTARPFYGGSKPVFKKTYSSEDEFLPKNKNRVHNIDAEPSKYDWLEFALYGIIGFWIYI